METKQIINGLLDRADRVADQSAGRIMRQAAERLRELDERTKYKPAPELMPMGALTYAIACSHCENRNKDAETCRKCRCEIESGFEVDPRIRLFPVTSDELKHLINDTIAYIWKLEEKDQATPERGYDSRKELLQKLQRFYAEQFPEHESCCCAEVDHES